jgi:hypothetical protein
MFMIQCFKSITQGATSLHETQKGTIQRMLLGGNAVFRKIHSTSEDCEFQIGAEEVCIAMLLVKDIYLQSKPVQQSKCCIRSWSKLYD